MSLISSAFVGLMIFWGVVCQAETRNKDVHIRMEHQKVFDEDGTYKQPDVVIRRSSYKNNLKFEADRLEGREPPTRPGINQLIRDDHEDDVRRREELETDDIVQRYVGHADEHNKTRLIVSPRSEAYRAPNKAKPLPSLPRYGLTPVRPRPQAPADTKAADLKPIMAESKAPPAPQTTQKRLSAEAPEVQIGTAQRRPLKNKVNAYTERSPVAQKLMAVPARKPLPPAEPKRPERVAAPSSSLSQGAAYRLGGSSTGYPSIRVAPSGRYLQEPPRTQTRLPDNNLRGEKPIVRDVASPDMKPRSSQPDVRIAPSGYYVQELSGEYSDDVERARGERPVVRDMASPETVYQQRLMQSDDEYLKLAPPELWETNPVVDQQTPPEEPAPVTAEPLRLAVWPGAVFGRDYVWGMPDSSQDASGMSEFAFGLPWQYLSKGWQIPALSTSDAAFAFLWFVVDLHQISRDAFKQRQLALQQHVRIQVRQRKLALLSAWLSDTSPDYLERLSGAERLTWQQYQVALQSELQSLPAQPSAGLTSGEQVLLNALEQQAPGSLNDLIARYRQTSLEYRFYHAYFQRLRRPGYGMATRLSDAELDALAVQEDELRARYSAFQGDVAELNRVLARHEKGMEYIQYLMEQESRISSGETQNKLVAALMNELDREEILLLRRLEGYQNLWMMAWHTNQFATGL